MQADFWHERWREGRIGFHESEANTLLTEQLHALCLRDGGRVFLPLCGKTCDIHWLLSRGYQVVGIELSELAVDALFADLGIDAQIDSQGDLSHYQAPNLDIYRGDVFSLSRAMLGQVDAVYDRAASVALPADLRQRYAAHLQQIAGYAPQLLISFEYEQSLMQGPPFSLDEAGITALYGESHHIQSLSRRAVDGGLKGKVPAEEAAWLLRPRHGSA